ncbi:MAG TPA: cell wall hydrolase [Bacillota bacterium]|nr:cell wall hydrolase [Bacillota bacterium]
MGPKKKQLLVLLATAGVLVNLWDGIVFAEAGKGVQPPEQNSSLTAVHRVSMGDCLWDISSKYRVSVRDIQAANGLTGTTIRVGQNLVIPHTTQYTIKAGDNLSVLAAKNKLTIGDLKNANNLEGDLIYPGQRLVIPEPNQTDQQQTYGIKQSKLRKSYKSIKLSNVHGYNFREDDIYLLAKLIHAEARGESLQGKIAVGAVIVNRLRDKQFPKTIREIILQKNGEVYQFSPVEDGSINLEPSSSSWQAARAALAGEDPTNGSLFFYNPEIATDDWIKTLPVTKVIGNHVFAR